MLYSVKGQICPFALKQQRNRYRRLHALHHIVKVLDFFFQP